MLGLYFIHFMSVCPNIYQRLHQLEIFDRNSNSFNAILQNQHVNLSNGIHTCSASKFRDSVNVIYRMHNNQTASTVSHMIHKWKPVIFGKIAVWDLLKLLHFTIDHTDRYLMYTSQLIHLLQVYNGIKAAAAADDKFLLSDDLFLEHMLLAALIHDMGKILTLLGESDENVDCMNRVISYGKGGLDGLKFQWNHDEYGYEKLRNYNLPNRVMDLVKFHSLREIPFLVNPIPKSNVPDPEKRASVTKSEAREFRKHMGVSDVIRGRFIAHFSMYDAKTKRVTHKIPNVNISEIHVLLNKYFPNGEIVF